MGTAVVLVGPNPVRRRQASALLRAWSRWKRARLQWIGAPPGSGSTCVWASSTGAGWETDATYESRGYGGSLHPGDAHPAVGWPLSALRVLLWGFSGIRDG